ncbi:MAG: type II secretion system protein GspG [Bdellovibrionales bacterium]|nr:type II secretion system protein GspG [Bdellovibrionales bacterium]
MILRELFNTSGFSLIEMLMVLILVGILSVSSIEYISGSLDESRFDQTLLEMQAIQQAIVGNPDMKENGSRVSFGYFGDVGAMPATISDLIVKPASIAAWSIDNTRRMAYGWNGPYLVGGNSGTDYTTDGWGNSYVYSPAASPPTLVSLGADGLAGGTGYNQDITISFPANERLATVEGFASDTGGPFAGAAEAEINYPDGTGGVTSSLDTDLSSENGHFSFSNIPFGVRSISLYEPTKAGVNSQVGPIVITIDSPNALVPSNLIDFNP